jgi:hypothetical protein
MINESRLEMVSSPSLVGGFHDVWAVLKSFRLSLSLCVCVCSLGLPDSEVNDAQVGFWRGCFMMY